MAWIVTFAGLDGRNHDLKTSDNQEMLQRLDRHI